jgi:hypothetical protein
MIERTDKGTTRVTGAGRELTLRQLIDFASENSQKVFEQYGCQQPMWLIALGNEIHVMPTPFAFDGPRQKEAVAYVMREAFKEFRVKRFVFIMEAWTYSVQATKAVDISKLVAPSSHPERQECIMISGEDVNGEAISVMRMIIREPGKPPRLAEAREMESGFNMLHGVFGNMLGVAQAKH